MFCHNCGTENLHTAKYCKNCGTLLKGSDAAVVKKTASKKTLACIIGAVLVLIAVVCAVLIGIRVKKAKEYDTYLVSAEKYLEELDYEQAEDFYLKAIEVAPKKLEPYVRLAEVYISVDEVEKAEEIIEKAKKKKAKGDAETEVKFEEIIIRLEEIKTMIDYRWAVDPTIEADDIYYVPEFESYGDYYGDQPLNNNYRQIQSDYAVIKRGDALGVIHMDGNVKGGLDYKYISAYEGNYMLIRKEPVWEPEFETEWDYYWLRDDELIADLGVGDFGSAAFYYYNGLREIYDDYEYWDVEPEEPRVPIPVKKSEEACPNDVDANPYRWWRNLSGNYGIYLDGEMRTDFIYEECGSYSEGLMAVSIDGKWGYVNVDGEVIIPIEYDASWPQFDLNWDEEDERDYCYAATEGYVVLCKDGQWELRDTTGEVAIPAGMFEEIRPVYEGKCWVKQAGKWGVIELLEEGEVEQEEVSTESIFKTIPREYVFTSGAGGWGTEMTVNPDGTFEGRYFDTNMGENGEDYPNGTIYESDFKGKFSEPEMIEGNSYMMKLEWIETEKEPGEVFYRDGWKHVAAEPYGLTGTDRFELYTKGIIRHSIPEPVLEWMGIMDQMGMYDVALENECVIYNSEGGIFVGEVGN